MGTWQHVFCPRADDVTITTVSRIVMISQVALPFQVQLPIRATVLALLVEHLCA